jgi:hypothetical protein
LDTMDPYQRGANDISKFIKRFFAHFAKINWMRFNGP